MSAIEPIAVVLGGFVAGMLNTLGGGGSLLTLPLLIFTGQDALSANGTNRVAILAQGVFATLGFRSRAVDMGAEGLRFAVPMMLGAAAGAALALRLGALGFERALAWVLLVMAALVFLQPQRWIAPGRGRRVEKRLALWFVVALLGAYAGFAQAGVGLLFLAAVVALGRLDLVRANALKVIVVPASSVVSLAIYAWHGHVDWTLGALLAVGMGAGGWVGARVQVGPGGLRWIRAALATAVAAAAIKLLR